VKKFVYYPFIFNSESFFEGYFRFNSRLERPFSHFTNNWYFWPNLASVNIGCFDSCFL